MRVHIYVFTVAVYRWGKGTGTERDSFVAFLATVAYNRANGIASGRGRILGRRGRGG